MLPDIDKNPKRPLIIKMAGYLERKDRMVSNIIFYVRKYIIIIRVLHHSKDQIIWTNI